VLRDFPYKKDALAINGGAIFFRAFSASIERLDRSYGQLIVEYNQRKEREDYEADPLRKS
jgi:hypothetical protein